MKAIKRQTNIKKVIENTKVLNCTTYVITPIDEFIMIGKDRVKPEHFKMMFPTKLITQNVYL